MGSFKCLQKREYCERVDFEGIKGNLERNAKEIK